MHRVRLRAYIGSRLGGPEEYSYGLQIRDMLTFCKQQNLSAAAAAVGVSDVGSATARSLQSLLLEFRVCRAEVSGDAKRWDGFFSQG